MDVDRVKEPESDDEIEATVSVAVRIRPLSDAEVENGGELAWRVPFLKFVLFPNAVTVFTVY